MKGLITKGIGGFYYVKTDEGIIEAKGRGIFKKDGIVLCVGDIVNVEILQEDSSKGVIDKIYPRKNYFSRPPISNIDLLLVVFAAKNPKPNYPIIDKFVINSQLHGIKPVICINKKDLISEEELVYIKKIYGPAYEVVALSTKTGEGIEELFQLIKGKTVALAGPSGVGKSSILNKMLPSANMETGQLSQKNMRGKHTTRHVEIFQMEQGGMVFDTPGFTSLELNDMDENDLRDYYPEFVQLNGLCRYDNCKHLKEPDCAVTRAVKAGSIHPLRYKAYVANMEELKNKNKY